MGVEIEKKFLVMGSDWKSLAAGTIYRQGYLKSGHGCTVRIRIAGEKGYLTIKGPVVGAARPEYEYEIPLLDADEILETLCDKPLIEKKRYKIPIAEHVWEVDEFFGENDGLVIAEIELERADEVFEKPEWIGKEVTGVPRYYNASLVNHPFKKWT
jgi:CYTH domain-containing protein